MKKNIPNKESLELLLKENMTYDAMCIKLNVSYPTFMKWLDEYKLVRNDIDRNVIMSKTISEIKMEKYV